MADKINTLTNHLLVRPIATIFLDCLTEQTNIEVLQLLCIIDYHTEYRGLYSRIKESSNLKLYSQLLKFRNFKNFRCYDYFVHFRVARRILQCKFCELTGPYKSILTHMAATHDAHISLITCAYCNKIELKEHIHNDSLDQCYENYMKKHAVQMDDTVFNIVDDFYQMLISVCSNLGICTVRKDFVGRGKRGNVEQLGGNYGHDFPTECRVFQTCPQILNKSAHWLHREAKRILELLYIGTDTGQILQLKSKKEDVICIDIDDDDDDDEANPSSNQAAFSGPSTRSEDKPGLIRVKREFMIKDDDDQMETRQTVSKRKLSDLSTPRPSKFTKNTSTHQDNYRESSPNIRQRFIEPDQSIQSIPSTEVPLSTVQMNAPDVQLQSPVESTDNSSTTGTELFCSLIAQKLAQIQDRNKREEAEIAILTAIKNAGK